MTGVTCVFGVQSHDILYKTSRYILYTPARELSERGSNHDLDTLDIQEQRVRFVLAAFQTGHFESLRRTDRTILYSSHPAGPNINVSRRHGTTIR